jgi:hypothetical protein
MNNTVNFPDSEVFNRINNQICPDKSDCKLHQEDKCNKWHTSSPMLMINWEGKYKNEEIMDELYKFLCENTIHSIKTSVHVLYDTNFPMPVVASITKFIAEIDLSLKVRAILSHMIFLRKVIQYANNDQDFYEIISTFKGDKEDNELFDISPFNLLSMLKLLVNEEKEFYSIKEYSRMMIQIKKLIDSHRDMMKSMVECTRDIINKNR